MKTKFRLIAAGLLAVPAMVLADPPVTGPKVWLRADLGVVTDGDGKVERWEDQSGNGHHFEQATAAKRPVVVAQGFLAGGGDLGRLPTDRNGSNTHNGSLGMDFVVEQAVSITHLAAFDHLRDGISGSITVQVWSRSDGGTVNTPQDDGPGTALAQRVFTTADPGELDGSYRWKSLAEPLVLAPGSYSLISWGYTGSDYYSGSTDTGEPTLPGVRLVGNSSYSPSGTPGAWPNVLNSDSTQPRIRLGAMNLRGHPVGGAAVARPALRFDGSDDGLQAVSALDLGRPSTVFVAYERDRSSGGYVIQNSSGGHWFIRNDGWYCSGWVRNVDFGWARPEVAAMVSTASDTRAWSRQDDHTHEEGRTNGTPGRLALGGGSGLGNWPVAARIAEVIAYDRELSPAEMWQTQAYLGSRYGIFTAAVAAPTVSPTPSPGTGSVEVSLTCATPGAEIRFTTDGSEPHAGSPLYGSAISVPRGTEVKARAFLAGSPPSGATAAFYGSLPAAELPVGGVSAWMRGDRGVSTDDLGGVTSWQDLTGNGNDLRQGTPGQRPRLEAAFPRGGGVAIKSLYGNVGSATHHGPLGADFVADQALEITQLGAFDHLGDGFASAVTVQIWSRDHRGTPATPEDDLPGELLAEMEFTPAEPGTLEGGTRWKSLPGTMSLPAGGQYTIIAWGFTGANLYRNSSDAAWNTDGLTFVHSSRYATTVGAWPNTMDYHPVKYNGAGNFRFRKAGGNPLTQAGLTFDGANDGLWAAATSNLPQPSTVYVAFERLGDGIVIQNSVSPWWFIRQDGGHSANWVANRGLPMFEPVVAALANGPVETRFLVNGDDWTDNPQPGIAAPGRLALGGGNGYNWNPLRARIAEVLVFDRELTPGERWQIENYLAGRYQTRPARLPAVAITPPSQPVEGPVEVSLSHPVAGATIFYTTDGSTPDPSTALPYSGTFSVPPGTEVKALAIIQPGGQPGPLASACYQGSGEAGDLPVSGASLWLRGDRGLDIDPDGKVMRWRDLSGNSNDLEQMIPSKRPTVAADGIRGFIDHAAILRPIEGGNSYAGSLGDDFQVHSAIEITHLGAFDHRADGFAGTITVQLWSRDDKGTPSVQTDDSPLALLAEQTFTTAAPGTLEGVARFKPLAAPLTLEPGAYTIFAWGYNGNDLYREGNYGSRPNPDSRLGFTGKSRYLPTAGNWPTSLDSAAFDYNGAANFKFTASPTLATRMPAIAFDGIDDGLRGLASMNLPRPSTVLVSFRRENGNGGYYIQNSNSPHWVMRHDGYYSGAWVANRSFDVFKPHVAAMVNGPDFTRSYRDGQDVTLNSQISTGSPGRLCLGGGSGYGNYAAAARVAEVVVFNRVLDESELWRMNDYLAARNAEAVPPPSPVAISPPSHFGNGNVGVSLACATPGAAIFYTLNDAAPDTAATSYQGPFSVPRGTRVRALAYSPAGLASPIAEAYYGDAANHPLPSADPAFWVRADLGVERNPNGAVTRWRDLSGNGRDLTSVWPGREPLWRDHVFGGAIKTMAATPDGATGGTTYPGRLGTDFLVERSLEITHLGVFDHAGDGIKGTLNVRLHRINDQGTPATSDDTSAGVLASDVFTAADPGTLDGGTRYRALAAPLLLEPGRYLLETWGWAGTDYYQDSDAWPLLLEHGISYPNVSRYHGSEVLPGNGFASNRYLLAGGLKFRDPGTSGDPVPAVRFDGVDDGMLGPQDFMVGRPSTVFLVYNQIGTRRGRLLQSGSGANWLLGPHSSTVQESDASWYYFNGVDLTSDPNPVGQLGRIAVGGGEGTYFEPGNADLVELIIYDRAMEAVERKQVAAALSARYLLPKEPLPQPSASPDGGLFASTQSLVLSHPMPGAQIRYTTDGSTPDESSALYNAPITVANSTTFKAVAFHPDYLPSPVQESLFSIVPGSHGVPQRESMQLWLRAAAGVDSDGGAVTRWRDLSGKGADAVQAESASRPLLVAGAIGGAPGLVFDGSNDWLGIGPGFRDFSQGCTAIFVVQPDQPRNWARFIDFARSAGNSNVMFYRETTTTNFRYGNYYANGSSNILTTGGLLQPATSAVLAVNHLPDGSVKIFHNGSLVAERTGMAVPNTALRTRNYIGRSNWSSDAYYSGAIAEIILYNRALGDLERETLEADVRAVYGIATSATGTVAFSPDPASLYPGGVTVTMQSVTEGAQIRYTLDGSTPDQGSVLYGGPITLTSSARIRARAFGDGLNPSQLSEATYYVGIAPGNGDGLLGTYFAQPDLSGDSLTRVDPRVDFNWGYGSPDPAIPVDQFSVRWTGKVMPRFSEDYTFHTSCDDGSRLWVDLNRDGQFADETELLVNDWTPHGETERASSPVPMVAGLLYDIKLEYFEANSSAVARLRWSSFSEPKAAIPQSQLFSNAAYSQTAATPQFTPPAGTYTTAVAVEITSATSGATVYYTTDGSEPDTTKAVYTGPVPLGASATLRARAYRAGFNPSGIATAVYHIDAEPPDITLFAWNNQAILNGDILGAKGTFSATATDNQGINRAEFYYAAIPGGSRVPLGTDTTPANGLSATWDIAGISDGNYEVTVRVFDTTGTWAELSRQITVTLAVPPAPQITAPVTGTSVQDPTVALTISGEPGANLRIFRDGTFLFAGYANSSGIMNHTASLPTGTSVFTATARNRAGDSAASNAVSVTRVREFPQLTLAFNNNTVGEGVPITGTISIPEASSSDLSVQISTNKPTQFEPLALPVIVAGTTSAEFTMVARQDTLIELLSTVLVSASAVEYRGTTVELYLADEDYPGITLELGQSSVSENHGSFAATVRRSPATDRALRVDLRNSRPADLTIPAYVDIPANTASRTFTIGVVDNAIQDGNRIASLHGEVRVSGTVVSLSPSVDLEVRDDEGPVLALQLSSPFVAEGSSVTATVTRSGAANENPLLVSISTSPAGQLNPPSSVTIPAGQDSTTFSVPAPDLPGSGGTRQAILRVAAAGFVDGLAQLVISDENRPELAPRLLQSPESAQTEQSVTVSYRIENYGVASTSGSFSERIFLSRDPAPGPDDILVRQIEMTGSVAAGAGYLREASILSPRDAGIYYLIVTVDPANTVIELDETNNTAVRMTPLDVRAAYSATVQTAAEVVPANTPLVFTGSATRESGQPASFSMVNIHLKVNNTNRVISAITNSLGQFNTTWTPLRNEGGVYTIGACHPGVASAPVQDSFEILTMGFDAPAYLVMKEGETVVTQATLRNPNLRPLTDIGVTVASTPAGLTITPQPPATTLEAGEEMNIPVTVTAAMGFAGTGQFTFTAQTAEGVTMESVFHIRIDLLKPTLSLSPGSINTSALRGTAKSESVIITNTGGLETGPVQVLLPDLPWLTLASANPIPSIPPGGSAAISLNIAPDAAVPLTQYTGNLALNAANGGSRSLPYAIRVVTDLKGDLNIDVVDELYFFTEAAPKLAGARVVVRDAISSAQVAAVETGTDGLAAFTNLNEGWYRIEVSAPEHDSHSGNYYINAGQANPIQIFISKQLVKYSWKVEEIEIQDVYRVTIETEFETNVPAPVVLVSPSSINIADLTELGQSKVINVTLDNQGWIDAQHSQFTFTDHPFYEFTPLISNIGTIPARSTLVIPVTIRRVGTFGEDGEVITIASRRGPAGRNGGKVPCGAAGAVDYGYKCGPHWIDRITPVGVSGAQGDCGGTATGYTTFVSDFVNTGGGGGGRGIPPGSSSLSFSSPDPCLELCLARSTVDCIIGFAPGPLGCIYAGASCIHNSIAQGSVDWWTCLTSPMCLTGPAGNAVMCFVNYVKCFYDFGGPRRSVWRRDGETQYLMSEEDRAFAPEPAAAWERVETFLRIQEAILGSSDRVLLLMNQNFEPWFTQFGDATLPAGSSGQEVDAAEITALQSLAADLEMDPAEATAIIERWNRTLAYGQAGIREIADVPAGQSTDFIPLSMIQQRTAAADAAYRESTAAGYIDPLDEFVKKANTVKQDLEQSSGGSCARVKIQLSQDVMMTRTAFRATLELQNERESGLSEVGFELKVRDESGQPAEDLFNIQVTQLTGLDDIGGNGQIPGKGTGTAQWTLIPRDTAALEQATVYTVGGVIRYVQDGTQFNIPVANVPVTVRPDAALDLKYFHQRDVFSDDPWTDAIEPSEPYKLAVMVTNNGYGEARNLRIISGQPEIVDNEKGLFIDFKIIATEVDGQPLSPSLTADFGNVAPGARRIATWYMTSTMQGLFTNYSATFEHVTGLGDPRLSLMQNVEIHEMIRMVRAQGARDDGRPDFLTNDVPDANDFPDTLHYSDGGTDLVTVSQTGTFSGPPGPGGLTIALTVPAFTGWSYIRLPDPGDGAYPLLSVTRSDGRMLPVDSNFWQTNRTFIGGGNRPRYENILHIADSDSPGQYTLVFGAPEAPDLTAPSSAVATLPAQSHSNIEVHWAGSDNRGVAFYDLFVSTNGGPWTLWRGKTRDSAGIYPGQNGSTYAFCSIATDNAGNVESKSLAAEASTTVSISNQPPELAAIAPRTVNERQVLQVQASATDPDGEDGEIIYSIATNQSGIIIHPVTGLITWPTGELDGGKTATVVVTATDSGSPPASDQTEFQINVLEVNHPPVITSSVGPQSLNPGSVVLVDIDANDSDSPAQSLVYTLDSAPPGASINPASGVISWAPTEQQAGQNFPFVVRVTDNGSPPLHANASFAVSVTGEDVTPDDQPPQFTSVPVVLWTKGRSYSLVVTATDPDGDPLSLGANLSAVAGAAFSDLGGGSGELTWNPSEADAGVYQVPVNATANGETVQALVRIRVEDDNLYWNWVKEAFGVLPADFNLALLDMNADPDGDRRPNVHEMAWLTHPLRPDTVPVDIIVEREDPFIWVQLSAHRRAGSEEFVDFGALEAPAPGGPWQVVPDYAWFHGIDADGDDDGRSETERMDFHIFDFHPDGLPPRRFYQLESKLTPGW
jgi:hypothetical protein